MIKDKHGYVLEQKYRDFSSLIKNIFIRYPHINSISWSQFLNIEDVSTHASYTIEDMKVNNKFVDPDRDIEYRQILRNIIEIYGSNMVDFFGANYSIELKRSGEIEISDYEHQF